MRSETANMAGLADGAPAASRLYEPVKRMIDVVSAGLGLVALSPLLGVCALAIGRDSAGPVLFRQQRIGENGKPFTMLKFRSMYTAADPKSHQEFTAGFIRGEETPTEVDGQSLYKLVGDPRVTRVGKWLRKTSLDELPQLWNVLIGDMSLVGPRPPLQYEVDLYSPADRQRLAVKPGITGLWQVSGRNKTTFKRMVELDVEYIRRRSIRLDLSILIKTIPVVLLSRDAC